MSNLTLTRHAFLRAAKVAFLATAVAATPASAASLHERAGDTGVRVAFYNFKPYAYVGADGQLTGTDVDTLAAVLKRMGGKIGSAQAVEWGALIPGVKAERFDVVAAGMFVTAKRCKAVQFSEPTFGIQQTLVVLKGNPEGVVDYDTVRDKGLKIAAVSGSAQVGYAEKTGINPANIVQLPDNPTAIAALRAGRAQVYAISVPGARELVKGVPEQDLDMVASFSKVVGKLAMPHGAFAFRPEDADFVADFNKTLTAFIGSGAHLAILEKHGMRKDELPLKTTSELCAE